MERRVACAAEYATAVLHPDPPPRGVRLVATERLARQALCVGVLLQQRHRARAVSVCEGPPAAAATLPLGTIAAVVRLARWEATPEPRIGLARAAEEPAALRRPDLPIAVAAKRLAWLGLRLGLGLGSSKPARRRLACDARRLAALLDERDGAVARAVRALLP